ncbi:signal-transducing adaptor protein 1-like [Pholidichthys leucotaenia]
MSMNPRLNKRRATITALPLYYSGSLLKKRSKEKEFKKYYGELRGTALFLYTDDTQETYTEKLDLEQLKSMELNSPYKKKTPTTFTLIMKTEQVELKMENADRGEEWRGYIMTVVKKQIPGKLQLLPGQILKLEEVLAEEKKRNYPSSRPPLPPRPSFLSSPVYVSFKMSSLFRCFFDVTRKEAERMLDANPEYGSIILRPSTMPNNYAVTLRQIMSSGPVKKNYRLTATTSGFVIELDTPVTVPTLEDVIKYFLEKTEYRLHPYMASQPYDTRIEPTPAPKCISISSAAPKKLPRAQVAPMQRFKRESESFPDKPEEGEYVIPDDFADDQSIKQELDIELREAVKNRRQNIYVETGKDDQYGEKICGKKNNFGAVQWMGNAE